MADWRRLSVLQSTTPGGVAHQAAARDRIVPVTRAQADVNLDAIAHNTMRLASAAPDARVMAVVKADGYGHGMIPVARAARGAGADYLGVALPEEAVAIRESGDNGPLLCWLYPPSADLSGLVERRVELSVNGPESLQQIVAAARTAERPARVHLKVDTGLGRNGSTVDGWADLVASALAVQAAGAVEVVGVWSHLASSDEPESPVTDRQVATFGEALAVAEAHGLVPEIRHLANSGGTLRHPQTHFDMVRCGISIYGLTPGPAIGTSAALGLIPAMTLTSEVALVKRVPAAHGVSYGHRYRTRRSTQLALIPVGYADGLPRSGSNRLPVMINGERFTVAGTVAMDQVVLDIGEAPVRAGEKVYLFGPGSHGEPTADDWAAASATINYEIVTRLGPRTPRRHLGGA